MKNRSVFPFVLIPVWLVSVAMFAASTLSGNEAFLPAGVVSAVLYIPALILFLCADGASLKTAPETDAAPFKNRSFASGLLKILGLWIVPFVLGAILTVQLSIQIVLVAVSVVTIVRRRDRLDRYAVVVSFLIGAVLLVSRFLVSLGTETPFDPYMTFYLATVPFVCLGGIVALRLSGGFARSLILEKRFGGAALGFLYGFLLALPPALVNVAMGGNPADAEYDAYWKPFVGALIPGFAEEIWARLFIVTVCYLVLRPNAGEKPRRAAVAAILVSAFTHAFWHFPLGALLGGGAVMGTLNALMFGVPMALLFVKRNFEAAVGFHYAMDFIRFMAAV